MLVIGLFVALSQVDFMLIRLTADLLVNHFTTFFFLKGKTVNLRRYNLHQRKPLTEAPGSSDEEFEEIVVTTPRAEQPAGKAPAPDAMGVQGL